MNTFAFVDDGIVRDILSPPEGVALEDCLHEGLVASYLACPPEVQPGWVYVGGEFSPPGPPAPPSKPELIAYAAEQRWRREAGGITVAGVSIATDDRSKVMIVGARVAAEADVNWSTNWHGADGQIYPLNASTMIAISAAVEAHVNSGFATFAEVKTDIESGAITTKAEIDAAFA